MGRLLALRPSIPAGPFLSLLQDVLRANGERAMGLQRLQESALWLTRRAAEEQRLFPWLNQLMPRRSVLARRPRPVPPPSPPDLHLTSPD